MHVGNKQSKADWRGEHTRILLIETAESLFSDFGIEAVSLRKIGTEAGSSNTNIVGYHFGNKTDLINAIFAHRIAWLEQQRGALYQQLIESDSVNLKNLIYSFYWPLYQQKNAAGKHSYAGFLAELFRSGHGELRRKVRMKYPVAEKLVGEMHKYMPDLSAEFFEARLHYSAVIITSCLRRIDQTKRSKTSSGSSKKQFLVAMDIAAAAFSAPVNTHQYPV